MDEKAQGAMEYLLIIGGAILVATIVVGILFSQTSGQSHTIAHASNRFGTGLEAIEQATDWGNTI